MTLATFSPVDTAQTTSASLQMQSHHVSVLPSCLLSLDYESKN